MNQKKLLNKSIKEVEDLLIVAYKNAYKDLYNMLIDTYMDILGDGDVPLNSHLYSFGRYYTLMNKLKDRLNELGQYEENILSDKLVELYKNNEQLMSSQFPKATYIDEAKIRQLLTEDWVGDGKVLSDRIWNDKTATLNKLKSQLVNSVITGKPISSYAKELSDRFKDVQYWQAKRLVRTEMNHMLLQSTIDKYKQAGFTKYKILTVDSACEHCKQLKDQVFDIDNLVWGANIPPLHPNCRCTIQAIQGGN